MIVYEILQNIRNKIRDQSERPLFANRAILDSIEIAQNELIIELNFNIKTIYTKCRANGEIITPKEIARLFYLKADGAELPIISQREAEAKRKTDFYAYIKDNEKLQIKEKQNRVRNIEYKASFFERIANENEEIKVPFFAKSLLIYRAILDILESNTSEANLQKIALFEAKFLKELNRVKNIKQNAPKKANTWIMYYNT